jgi:DNA-binding XRE family transcriptional regulator
MRNGKKRTANLSLKRLREIVGTTKKGMTQKQFAAMIGASLPLIKAVESGQYHVKEPLARKIAIATGAQLMMWDFRNYPKTGKAERVPVPNGKIFWLPLGEEMASDSAMQRPRPSVPARLSSPANYERKHYEFHRRFFKTGPEAAKLALKEALPKIEELFKAAAKPGVAGIKDRLPALRASLWNWMHEASDKFKLGIRPPGD